MSNKYKRPYCKNCKTIYSKNTPSFICSKCRHSLKLKSFNPWPSAICGILVLLIASSTLLIDSIPIIWIGGFIFGVSLMIRGLNQWEKIKNMEGGTEVGVPEKRINEEVITCGNCDTKNYVKKGLGYTEVKCPNCSRLSKIIT